MPRQRFIHPDFWKDPTIGKLTPLERLFFIGCFSNADDEGRLPGDPSYLKAIIFPYDNFGQRKVKVIRDRVVSICRNLVLYQVDGQEYLAFRKWHEYQKPRYPKASKCPPPPEISASLPQKDESLPQNTETLRQDCSIGFGFGMGLGWDGDGFGFGASTSADAETLTQNQAPSGGNPNPPETLEALETLETLETSENLESLTAALEAPEPETPRPFEAAKQSQKPEQPQLEDATTLERAILHELKQVPGFPSDYSKNLAFIRTLAVDFPDLDLLEQAKKWRVYKLDKPLLKKSNPRLQFRNWCEIAAKRRAKTETAIRASPGPKPASPKRIPRAFESLMEWAKEDDP